MSETQTVEAKDVASPPPAMTPGEAIAAVEKKKAKATEYHVLKLVTSSGANEQWTIHARNVEAQGAQAAIRKSVTASDQAQTFVAVPSRSFQPITVTVETKTQLVLS
jgi:hypothetical protein